MIRTMRRAVLGCAAITLAVALAPPAQAAGFSQQTIPQHGTWYSYGSPTVNHFRSDHVPWGVIHTDVNGVQTVQRIGTKTMWLRWTLVGVGYSGILTSASQEDFHYMDKLVISGNFADGAPNDGGGDVGAGNLISNCPLWEETIIPAFVGAGPGAYCARYDSLHSHHNMTTEFAWELTNYGSGHWYCYIRSTVSLKLSTWRHYWFINPVLLRIAGLGGPFYSQRHMSCGSTVESGFGGPLVAGARATDRGYITSAGERAARISVARHNAALKAATHAPSS